MKKILIACIASAFALSACVDLDLAPLSEGSSETWYSSQQELEMSINDFYRTDFFPIFDRRWGDDLTWRNITQDVFNGSMTAESSTPKTHWQNYYKGIARALRIIGKLDNARAMGVPESTIALYEGQARFYMGYAYGMLAFFWGDAILDKEGMTLDQAYSAARSPKAQVLEYAYWCFDEAAAKLPETHGGIQYATKGAALAFKARMALWNGDYDVAAKAAKACMDLNVYKLESNYQNLFTNAWSDELIFGFRGDVGLKKYYYAAGDVNNTVGRVHGGWGTCGPSYELVCAYTCIDGKPIDESPLYNPKDLFENRDPRLAMTVVPFATAHNKKVLDGTYDPAEYSFLGVEHSPAPTRTTVYSFKEGKEVSNTDSKARAEHAAYHGFIWKKFIDETWLENGRSGAATTYPYLRYGDVLLMYAEAMIEQNKCTQEVLDLTVNKLRERAYAGTGITYPKATNGTQAQNRTMIRTERFVEMAGEGWRYHDLLRWRLAEVVFNRPQYYLKRVWSGSASWNGDPSSVSADYKQMIDNWNNGCYPIGGVPQIDENGIADVSYMVDAGYIVVAAERRFDKSRDYLWPVPAADRLINDKLDQNENW